MPNNELDNIFKDKIGEISNVPGNYSWDKESSWERLTKKRRQKLKIRMYYYAAALLIFGLIISQLTNSNIFRNEENYMIENSELEFQKRQKLAEIESRMSGNYYSVKLCSVCDEIYFQSVKIDRPVQFLYFETN